MRSALQDQRFQPIGTQELSSLSCTVSFLTHKEPAQHCHDWTVGVHGIIIAFKGVCWCMLHVQALLLVWPAHRPVCLADPVTGQQRTATFLPEVAYHEGWDQKQAIQALVRKSGYHGGVRP